MGSDNRSTPPEDSKRCDNCRHCIDIWWMDKIVCVAFLETRDRVKEEECGEFTRK